mmetsp:Transcript_30122/g.64113  ORF Transcript_30122/g.64113 Transcript_30122/m.64113 type:complete len:1173 (+) Transcript_30122:59-3577(+)
MDNKSKQEQAKYISLAESLRQYTDDVRSQLTPMEDDIASHYSGVSEDETADRDKREAAMLISVAEGHLNEEATDEAMETATEALNLFTSMKDPIGMADAYRLVVTVLKIKNETKQALDKAAEAKELFKKESNQYGVALMMMVEAEVQLYKNNHGEALESLIVTQRMVKPIGDKRLQANVLLQVAEARLQKYHFRAAVEAADEAQRLFKEADDKKGEAKTWLALSKMADGEGSTDSMQAAKKALDLYKELGDQHSEVSALQMLAESRLDKEDPKEAHRLAREALALARGISFNRGERVVLRTLVSASIAIGDKKGAQQEAKEGIAAAKRKGDKKGEAASLDVLVQALLASGEQEAALRAGWEAMEILRELGDRKAHSRSLLEVAMLHCVNSQEDWALEAAQEASTMFEELADEKGLALVQHTLVQVYLQKDQSADAITACGKAQSLFKEQDEWSWVARTHMTFCGVYRTTGDAAKAAGYAQRASWAFEDVGDKRGMSSALLEAAEIHFATAMLDRALRSAKKADQVLEGSGYPKSQAIALSLAANIALANENPQEALVTASNAKALFHKVDDRRGEGAAFQAIVNAHIDLIMLEAKKFETIKKPEVEEDPIDYGGQPPDWQGDPVTEDPWEAAQIKAYEKVEAACEAAQKVAKEAVAAASKADDLELHASALHAQAQVFVMSHKADEALTCVNEAIALGRKNKDKRRESLSLVLSAEVFSQLGKTSEAISLAEQGLKMARKLGDDQAEKYAVEVVSLLTGEAPVSASSAGGAGGGDEGEGEELAEAGGGLPPSVVRECVRDECLQLIGIDDKDMDDDTPLMDSGLDSLSSVEFRNSLAKTFNMNLPATLTFDYPSIRALTEHVVETSIASAPGGGGGGKKSTKAVKAAGGGGGGEDAAAAAARRARASEEAKVTRPCIAGSFNNWAPQEMNYDSASKTYTSAVRLGINGWESFQIVCDGDWNRVVHPDVKDGCPHEPMICCGPDDENHGKNFTIGKHAKDAGKEGMCWMVKLSLRGDGGPEKVEWTKLDAENKDALLLTKEAKSKEPKLRTGPSQGHPFMVGTWNNWGTPSPMVWSEADSFYSYDLRLGINGWESFQILISGEWRRCVHPDKKDGCPHMQHSVLGPDPEGDKKNWTVGKHPLDKGGEGVRYKVRLFLKVKGGWPEKVDWIRND